jgi:hypothetical protein
MQLPAQGHPLHTRSLTITATVADEGRWHVRGDIVDLRKCSFVPMTDDLQPAGIIHQMHIVLGLDLETRRMETVEVGQPHVAVEATPASGGECCRDPAPRLEELAGEVLDDGFAKRLGLHFGGPLGCSHLLTLFQLISNALPAALDHADAERTSTGIKRAVGERPFRRSVFVDGFETDENGDLGLAAQLGDFYTRPAELSKGPLGRLEREHAVRAYTRVEQATRSMRELRVSERVRSSDTMASAVWQERTHELASISGGPIIPGLARNVMGLLADKHDRAQVRDLLLQLAPSYIQVLAATSERFFTAALKPDRAATPVDGGERDSGSSIAALGGMADSCYMWRSGGPLNTVRQRAEDEHGAAPSMGNASGALND